MNVANSEVQNSELIIIYDHVIRLSSLPLSDSGMYWEWNVSDSLNLVSDLLCDRLAIMSINSSLSKGMRSNNFFSVLLFLRR